MYKVIAAIGVVMIVAPLMYNDNVVFNEYKDYIVGLGVVVIVGAILAYYESKR